MSDQKISVPSDAAVEVKIPRLIEIVGTLRADKLDAIVLERFGDEVFLRAPQEASAFREFLDSQVGADRSVPVRRIFAMVEAQTVSGQLAEIAKRFLEDHLVLPLSKAEEFKAFMDVQLSKLSAPPDLPGSWNTDALDGLNNFTARVDVDRANRVRARMPLDFGHCRRR